MKFVLAAASVLTLAGSMLSVAWVQDPGEYAGLTRRPRLIAMYRRHPRIAIAQLVCFPIALVLWIIYFAALIG